MSIKVTQFLCLCRRRRDNTVHVQHVVNRVKCPLFLSEFNQKRNVSKKKLVKNPNKISQKSVPRE